MSCKVLMRLQRRSAIWNLLRNSWFPGEEQTDVDLPRIVAVGITDKAGTLAELPVRVLFARDGQRALRHLRAGSTDLLIGRWELANMEPGELFERVREAKPYLPTLAVVEAGNVEQEIAARSLGVSVVLPEDVGEGHFREVVCDMLGLPRLLQIEKRHTLVPVHRGEKQ